MSLVGHDWQKEASMSKTWSQINQVLNNDRCNPVLSSNKSVYIFHIYLYFNYFRLYYPRKPWFIFSIDSVYDLRMGVAKSIYDNYVMRPLTSLINTKTRRHFTRFVVLWVDSDGDLQSSWHYIRNREIRAWFAAPRQCSGEVSDIMR